MVLPTVADEKYEANDWYEPDQASLARINAAGPCEIIVLHAGWCKDCQYFMPLWNRLCGLITNEGIRVTYSFVTRDPRADEHGFCDKYEARKVPTWIVLREGKEIGRIVENPAKSLEEDLAAIL